MFRYLAILAILPVFALGQRVTFTECVAGGTPPSWVEIEGCDELSCIVRNNQTIVMSGELTSEHSAVSADLAIHAFLGILSLPIELPAEIADGCNAFPQGCPVNAGSTYRVGTQFAVAVPDLLLNQQPYIELSIVNEQAVRILCARTQIQIVA